MSRKKQILMISSFMVLSFLLSKSFWLQSYTSDYSSFFDWNNIRFYLNSKDSNYIEIFATENTNLSLGLRSVDNDVILSDLETENIYFIPYFASGGRYYKLSIGDKKSEKIYITLSDDSQCKIRVNLVKSDDRYIFQNTKM